MIVVDASIVMKWIEEEKDTAIARAFQMNHLEGKEEIVAPQLLFYEIANTLSTKSFTTPSYIAAGLDLLSKMHLVVYKEEQEDILQAALLAREYDVAFYDMLYVVVAQKNACLLVTADERFVKKTEFSFVKLLSEI